jgi:predicted nucleic-acid-binding Zn-ribbon protein
MERCPICRARLRGESNCRRCGADLSRLLEIGERSHALQRCAVACIARGEAEQAERVLLEALGLKQGVLARMLLGFVRQSRERQGPPWADPSWSDVQTRS